MKPVIKPNLPENAHHVMIGQRYAPLLKIPLRALGLEPIFMPDNPDIDERIAAHADMSVLHLGRNKLLMAPYLKDTAFSAKVCSLGFEAEYPDIRQSRDYPHDAELNICIIGDKAIQGKKNRLAEKIGLNKQSCAQGYSRCSICIVSENAVITEDSSIERAAKVLGIDVLKLKWGGISLEGFEHGFIGGASFKISRDKLAFTGDISKHPEYALIKDFLSKHGVEPVILTSLQAFDIGTAIPITEGSK